jgi:hypothetical protein
MEEAMAHTHDRTLLNRIGFMDPDKKLPRHDMACRYLAQPAILQKLMKLESDAKYETHLERVISKGSHQYLQHVGFVDLWVVAQHRFRVEQEVLHAGTKFERPGEKYTTWDNQSALIEVKISPVLTSDIIRQLNLYREYTRADWKNWGGSLTFAVVDFDLTASDRDALMSADIRPVRLGADFEAWLAAQEGQKADIDSI